MSRQGTRVQHINRRVNSVEKRITRPSFVDQSHQNTNEVYQLQAKGNFIASDSGHVLLNPGKGCCLKPGFGFNKSGLPGLCLFVWCFTAHQHKKAISAKNRCR